LSDPAKKRKQILRSFEDLNDALFCVHRSGSPPAQYVSHHIRLILLIIRRRALVAIQKFRNNEYHPFRLSMKSIVRAKGCGTMQVFFFHIDIEIVIEFRRYSPAVTSSDLSRCMAATKDQRKKDGYEAVEVGFVE
jgi:hypothetical protein